MHKIILFIICIVFAGITAILACYTREELSSYFWLLAVLFCSLAFSLSGREGPR